MKKFSYTTIMVMALSAFLVGCGGDDNSTKSAPKTEVLEKEEVSPAALSGDFEKWHSSALSSSSMMGKSKSDMQPVYNQIHNYSPMEFGMNWIISMAKVAESNKEFRKSVLGFTDMTQHQLADLIIKVPQNSTRFAGSDDAFAEILSTIARNDDKYRLLSAQFEASAREQSIPRSVAPKLVKNPSFIGYTTKQGQPPSVIERILSIATLNVIRGDNRTLYQKEMDNFANNQAVTNCLNKAKFNSAQCSAASYDNRDLSFCTAKHSIGEVSQCMSWILP